MRKKIFFIAIFFLPFVCCFSQDKSFENYSAEVKNFVSNFKTYKIVVVRGDTSFTPRFDGQRDKLKISFPFLHLLKEVKKNPDLFVRIIIKDTNINVDYTLFSANSKYNVYQLKWFFDLKFLVKFDAGAKGSLTVPLCDFIHYEKFPPGSEHGLLSLSSDIYSTASRPSDFMWNDIDYWVSGQERYLQKRAEFMEEFISALEKFSKDQCK